MEKYNSITDAWTDMAPMHEKRRLHMVATVGNKIYAMGGSGLLYHAESRSIEMYDTVENTWTMQNETMLEDTCDGITCVVGKNIYLFGGRDGAGQDHGSVLKFDTVAKMWTTLPDLKIVIKDNSVVKEYGGSATLIGDFIYIIRRKGIVKFDPRSQTVTTVKSLGAMDRIGGKTFSLHEQSTKSEEKATIVHPAKVRSVTMVRASLGRKSETTGTT